MQFNVVYSQKKKKQVHEKGKTKKDQEKIVENLPNGTRVAVDPGKYNIIYMVGFVNNKRTELRYTNVQRYYLYFLFLLLIQNIIGDLKVLENMPENTGTRKRLNKLSILKTNWQQQIPRIFLLLFSKTMQISKLQI